MSFRRTALVDLGEYFPVLADPGVLADADLLIVVNGFEERTTNYVQRLAGAGLRIDRAAVLRFGTNRDDNEATLPTLLEGLDAIGAEHQFIDVDEIESGLAALIMGLSDDAAAVRRATFDISGASGKMILRTMRCLFEMTRSGACKIDLTVTYTEAVDYKPDQQEAEDILQSLQERSEQLSGEAVADPLSLGPDWDAHDEGANIEYTGQSGEGLPERAVVICGFNANRVRVALDAVDPAFNADIPHSGVTYIAGLPPSPELAWRLDVMKRINTYGAAPDGFDFTPVSTLQYMATLDALEAVYEDGFGAQRMTIIPFGSKMQSLAVALFCELHPDVRAQLVAPKRYEGKDYSTGCGPTHSLSFGDLGVLAEHMRDLGSLVFEPREGAMTGWTQTTSE